MSKHSAKRVDWPPCPRDIRKRSCARPALQPMYLRGLVRPGACLFLLPVRATIRPRSAQSPSPKINVLNRPRRITRAKAPRVLRSDLLSSPPGKISIRYARSMSGTFVRVPCPALSCDQWYGDKPKCLHRTARGDKHKPARPGSKFEGRHVLY